MRFTSIKEVIETTGINSKAAECLGKAGAFCSLDEELNEIEAAAFARETVLWLRAEEKYIEQIAKYRNAIDTKEEKFRNKVEERRVKQEAKDKKYKEKITEYEQKRETIQKENLLRINTTKKSLNEPKKPAKPKELKEITYPKYPTEPMAPQKLAKPRIILSIRERIKLQREMLYLYLTGHPLDEVPEKKDITKIKDLLNIEEDSWLTIRGVLQFLKVTNTRKKKLMGRLRIEDKTGSIEVVAFPHVYESLKNTLVEGELYEIMGRVDITRRESDTGEEFAHTQFIGTKVKTIRVGSDKEWDLIYPLLKGNLRVLPGNIQKSKGLAMTILARRARKRLEVNIG